MAGCGARERVLPRLDFACAFCPGASHPGRRTSRRECAEDRVASRQAAPSVATQIARGCKGPTPQRIGVPLSSHTLELSKLTPANRLPAGPYRKSRWNRLFRKVTSAPVVPPPPPLTV